jgi:hypothetical protein
MTINVTLSEHQRKPFWSVAMTVKDYIRPLW